MTDGLKDRHRDAIIALLAANDRVEKAVLFGSRAMQTGTDTSDVAIALFGDKLSLTDQARLAAAIDEIPMAQSVDLLLHRTIDHQPLIDHIRTHGVEWYRRDRSGRYEILGTNCRGGHVKLDQCALLVRNTVCIPLITITCPT